MKKFLSLLLVLCMLLPVAALAEEAPAIKLGQAAYIDEYQVGAGMVGVPNSENGFGGFADGKVLYSKRVNAEAYSANMAKSGSTVALDVNYDLIQEFVVGKTIAELETIIAGFGGDATKAVDAVSGATLVDTLGYLQGLLAAAKAAK